jgi:hypothetical protein
MIEMKNHGIPFPSMIKAEEEKCPTEPKRA